MSASTPDFLENVASFSNRKDTIAEDETHGYDTIYLLFGTTLFVKKRTGSHDTLK